jgi:uncharacterized protein
MKDSALKHAGYRLLKKPFFGRFNRPWRWPKGVSEEAYQRHEVVGRSGARLRVLIREAAQARGVLVLAHPMGAAAKGFYLRQGHVDAFVAAGFHCVTFDFNGFGESESTDFDYSGDLLAVAHWAGSRFPGLPMAAVGASFGAMRAMEAAADASCRFSVIVAEAVAPSLPEFWKIYPLHYTLLRLLKLASPGGERRLRPSAMIREYPPGRSVLLIHSHADRFTPPSHGDALEHAAPPHVLVERLVLEKSEHTHALRDERERYLGTVLEFLERRLGLPARSANGGG